VYQRLESWYVQSSQENGFMGTSLTIIAMSGHIFNASIIARVYQDQHNQGDFDPRNQSFVLLAKDGSMHLNRLSFVKDFQHQFFLDGCILASEIGATAVMLILYVLLTTGIKRRSTMFVMNSLAMFLNILRLSTFMHYYDDPWQDPYAMLTQDIHTYVRPREIAYSTASGIFNVLMLITLYGAMFVQIWVACHKIRVLYRNIVYAVSTTLVLFGMGLTLLNQVSVIENNIHHRDTRSAWNIPAEFIVRALMIFWTALVFTTRMGRNMWRMRRVGNKTFGVIQIFLIMGVYGLTTPSKWNSTRTCRYC
jgi:pheromone alpha factor receptor